MTDEGLVQALFWIGLGLWCWPLRVKRNVRTYWMRDQK